VDARASNVSAWCHMQ